MIIDTRGNVPLRFMDVPQDSIVPAPKQPTRDPKVANSLIYQVQCSKGEEPRCLELGPKPAPEPVEDDNPYGIPK